MHMTLTIELSPEQEAIIRQQAARHGLEPAEYILSLVDEAILFDGFEPVADTDPQERAEAVAGIQRGLDDFSAGRHRPAARAFTELRTRHGIPG
jgi:hypothetical protein